MRDASALAPDLAAVRGSHVLVALSGGCDSVALIALLHEGRERFELTLSAAHLDHGIRAQSAEDAAFCRELCQRLDIPLHLHRVDVPAEAARTGEGLETVARRLRYEWLHALRQALGARCIALAHHMDDQAETVLMHLARGTGPEGIGGMRELSGALYRPLLGYRKRELANYLAKLGLDWREDATNAIPDTPRNAIRMHVVPELEKSYPQFVPAAARYAQSARIESDFVAQAAAAFMEERVISAAWANYIDLSGSPPRAILRRAIRAASGCGDALTWDRLNAVEALCARGRGRLDLSADIFAERTGRGIYFVRRRQSAIEPEALSLNGRTRLDGLCTVSAAPCARGPIRDDPMRQVLGARALEGAVLRIRRPGDRIRPLGCGDRLLSDYLIDRKVDRPLRDHVALVAAGNRVYWACGLGISQEVAVRADSADTLLLECSYDFPFER